MFKITYGNYEGFHVKPNKYSVHVSNGPRCGLIEINAPSEEEAARIAVGLDAPEGTYTVRVSRVFTVESKVRRDISVKEAP